MSLCCLLLISWFICSRRWCVGGLWVIHANQTSVCLGLRMSWDEVGTPWGPFKPNSEIFLLTVPGRYFFCGSALFLLCFRARLFIDALWSPAGKGLTSWLSFVVSNCELVTFPFSGILGQVWYLIVSIPDLCTLTYFAHNQQRWKYTNMSKCMRFPTMWNVRPAKPQISLRIRAVWSEPLLVTWVFYDC